MNNEYAPIKVISKIIISRNIHLEIPRVNLAVQLLVTLEIGTLKLE
jgi:hypothetical protein